MSGQHLRRRGKRSSMVLLGAGLLVLAPRFTGFAGLPGTLPRSRSFVPPGVLAPLSSEDLELVKQWEEREGVLDGEATAEQIKRAAFPIPPEELIARAKRYLAKNQYAVVEPELLADDFVFCGPVVGPLGKEDFIQVLGDFDLLAVIPDNIVRWHDFRVDPFEPSRVWFTGRPKGRNTGSLPPLIPEENGTGIEYEGPPEAASLTFNAEGKITQYTAAYVLDKNIGNTDGMTGILGILRRFGRTFPIPEAQPYSPSPLMQVLKWMRKA